MHLENNPYKQKPVKLKQKLTIALNGFSIFLLFTSLVLAYQVYQINQTSLVLGTQDYDSFSSQSKEVLVWPQPESLTLNTLFFGDVFWGRRIQKWSEASDLKEAYPFSQLDTFEREKYDAWIANFECPITGEELTDYQQETLLQFNCRPEYLPEAKKYFDVVSLSNNHTNNINQEKGLIETRQNLEGQGFQYFGHFDNSVKEDICEVVSFPLKDGYSSEDQKIIDQILNQNKTNELNKNQEDSEVEESNTNFSSVANPELQAQGSRIIGLPVIAQEAIDNIEIPEIKEYYLPVAMCGYHNVFRLPTQEELKVVSQYSDRFITIVMPHQGSEYGAKSDDFQKQVYRQLIDLGADFVIGGHTHSIHETESYKGKLIAYSLGNFIFDQQFSNEVTRGLGINLDFEIIADDRYTAWQEIAKNCLKHKDDCLQKAEEMDLKKPNFKVKYDIVASDNYNQITKKASQEIYNFVLARTKWEQTVNQLETNFISETSKILEEDITQ